MAAENSDPSGVGFPTTLWSQVIMAGRGSPRAFDELSRRYRPVIFKLTRWFLLAHGPPGQDPEDLTQEFFLFLTEERTSVLGGADRHRGRFRAWLRTCLKHWLYNWGDRMRARKRGGGVMPASLEAGTQIPADTDLDREFDRQWGRDVMAAAMGRMKDDVPSGRLQAHDLRVWEMKYGGSDPPVRRIAEMLGLTENAVVVSLRRTKKAFRNHLRAEVESTVATGADLEEEMNDLRRAFSL